jgi:hypothetical protein
MLTNKTDFSVVLVIWLFLLVFAAECMRVLLRT